MSALVVTAKDLLLLVRDRRTAAMLLVLPLCFIGIIGLTTGKFPGLGAAAPALRVVVADTIDYAAIGAAGFADPPDEPRPADVLPSDPFPEDEAAAERLKARNSVLGLMEALNTAEPRGARADTPEHWAQILGDDLSAPLPADPAAAARELVDRGLVHQAVVFEPDFYRIAYTRDADELLAAQSDPATRVPLGDLGVEVYSSGTGGTAGTLEQAVNMLVQGRIGRLLTCRSPRRAAALPKTCGLIAAELAAGPREAPLSTAPADGGVVSDVYDELVPGYTTMFVFFLVNLMARSFLHERDLGTLRRLRTTPVRPTSILVGKTLPFFLISLLQTATLFLAGKLLFGMSWGPRPWMLVPIVVSCSAAATGLGLLVATLVNKEAQVSAYATSTVILLAGISGCFMPRDWLPDTVQTLSLATPHAWALVGYDHVLSVPRPGWGKTLECSAALCGFAAAFLALGAWRFGSRTD